MQGSGPEAIDAGLLSFIGLGRLPFLLWLMLLLALFGLIGLGGWQVMISLIGSTVMAGWRLLRGARGVAADWPCGPAP